MAEASRDGSVVRPTLLDHNFEMEVEDALSVGREARYEANGSVPAPVLRVDGCRCSAPVDAALRVVKLNCDTSSLLPGALENMRVATRHRR
mmetsp:Transcript_115780/g.327476  ORF Transcript_115780/g.327476 Transcript_115780/m.327476 type:complete len:91 (+) Transcript_115780:1608-1880(+)